MTFSLAQLTYRNDNEMSYFRARPSNFVWSHRHQSEAFHRILSEPWQQVRTFNMNIQLKILVTTVAEPGLTSAVDEATQQSRSIVANSLDEDKNLGR